MKSRWLAASALTALVILSMIQAKPRFPPSSDLMLGKGAGEDRDDNGLRMILVWCPPGSVTMENVELELYSTGDERLPVPNQTPRIIPVEVMLTQGYWIGKFEVTQSEWKQVMNTEPWKGQERTKEGAHFPATYVSWHDAVGFCRTLTALERRADRLPNEWEYALPTEAQWERACRAGTTTKFSFGNDVSNLSDYAWFSGNAARIGEKYAHEIGQKKANPWNIYDMHGNVYEWCRDSYLENLTGGRDLQAKPDAGDSRRVHRGGGWGGTPVGCSSAFRHNQSPNARVDSLGFRVALCPVRTAE